MSTKNARDLARAARKKASPELYGIIRELEKAIDALAKDIDALREEVRRAAGSRLR